MPKASRSAQLLGDLGFYRAAREAKHQANRLRRLAAGARPEQPVVDIERQLAAGQLRRWAGRRAA